MIKIKLQKDKKKDIIFKIKIAEEDLKLNKNIKRAIMDSKPIKGLYNYEIPLRYFIPISISLKNNFYIDKSSIFEYLEFFDEYDDVHYFSIKATAGFMKKWRKENCPNIFKVSIDKDTLYIKKEIVFKKNRILLKQKN